VALLAGQIFILLFFSSRLGSDTPEVNVRFPTTPRGGVSCGHLLYISTRFGLSKSLVSLTVPLWAHSLRYGVFRVPAIPSLVDLERVAKRYPVGSKLVAYDFPVELRSLTADHVRRYTLIVASVSWSLIRDVKAIFDGFVGMGDVLTE